MMQRLRVALLGNAANEHTMRWARWLAAHRHEVLLVTDRESTDPVPGVKEVRIEPEGWQRAKLWLRRGDVFAWNGMKGESAGPHLREFAPDVVHSLDAVGWGEALSAAPRGSARVLMPWGSDVLWWPKRSWAARRIVRRAMRLAHAVTGNGPGLEEELAALGAERAAMYMFSWGASDVYFTLPSRREVEGWREVLGIAPGTRIVLSPRSAKGHLGAARILRGWAHWRREAPESQSALVLLRGHATDRDWSSVLAMKDKLVTDDSVRVVDRLLGWRELLPLYHLADAAVMMPRTDFRSLTMLEFMACGVFPILAPLPAYRGRVADMGAEPEAPVRGVLLGGHSPQALAEGLSRWDRLADDDLAPLLEGNRRAMQAEERFSVNAPKIIEVYDRALRRARARSRA
ncbi:MAG: glycosyltransferase [Candidatus Sumerlaeia bacterium]|nr:glycosyltransferase [Candidatus Sumerlaeia bacterium]